MKKLLSLGLLCLGLGHTPAFAHKEWVHQYMVKQSYLYLEQQIGAIPALRNAIGLNYHGKGNDAQPFNTSYPIGIGAWREDTEDPVYGYRLGVNSSTPSITHFWDADNPNENYESVPLNVNGSSKAPNAWEKARVYLFCQDRNGTHDVTIPYVMPGVGYLRNYIITYTSLPELYKGNYFLEGISNADGSGRVNYYHLPQFNQSFGQPVALQLLGRVAHLLGDMSVPAHTHSHFHPCPLNLPDHYENDMGNTYYSNNNLNVCENDPGGAYPAYSWSAATAAQQGGLISDIYCQPNDMARAKYMFYTVNQLADFFPSGVNFADMGAFSRGGNQSFGWGDTNLSQGSNAYINSVYSSFGWSSPTNINTAQIANVNFNFSIRAVATLFQWFAYNAGIIEDLKNQKIASASTLVCPGSSMNFTAPTTAPVTWSVEPSFAATGLVVVQWFTQSSHYSVTPTPGYNGMITIKASYNNTDGCYAGPVNLTRQVWVGGPRADMKKEPATDLVCPGLTMYFEAGVSRPDLEGTLSYAWSSSAPGFRNPGNTPLCSIIAPNSYDVPVTVSCVVTNSCGLSSTIERYYTTANPNTNFRIPCDNDNPGGVYSKAAISPASSGDALEVFPNPSNTGFELVIAPAALLRRGGADKLVSVSYSLRDNLGRTMTQGTSLDTKVYIDTRSLAVGVYFLSCSVDGQLFHKRVQVLH
ncbi:hypothetical protein [Hymenobacter elongatus]|uniref:T9SS type A sorting domain-containing protein n=1 Tax=Hymenobacter elongatus TaxID=877208 RepID=A0A4Z0PLN8_9BACT|nr:hypothetical protein [Hymenobacter elongatus]TGE16959.1 hypothetical protein E5J99_08185 [Hymenobacter elongatus]